MVFMDIGHQQYNINTILKIPSLNWFFSAGSVPAGVNKSGDRKITEKSRNCRNSALH